MFFATTSPAEFSRQRQVSAGRSLERFLVEAQRRPSSQQQQQPAAPGGWLCHHVKLKLANVKLNSMSISLRRVYRLRIGY